MTPNELRALTDAIRERDDHARWRADLADKLHDRETTISAAWEALRSAGVHSEATIDDGIRLLRRQLAEAEPKREPLHELPPLPDYLSPGTVREYARAVERAAYERAKEACAITCAKKHADAAAFRSTTKAYIAACDDCADAISALGRQ